ncbi:MAG: hypothetical protein QM622_08100 [Microbacterium sp.]
MSMEVADAFELYGIGADHAIVLLDRTQATGIPNAADEWMQLEPFQAWLGEHTASGGVDVEAGTVLMWRDAEGTPAHAAVALGDGWLLHKPSQGGMSPAKVLGVRDGMLESRHRGLRLTRRRIR